jgi:hypothetical protein
VRLTKDRRINLRVTFEDARAEVYAQYRHFSSIVANSLDGEEEKYSEPRRQAWRNVLCLLDEHARTRSEGQLIIGVVKARDELVKTRNRLDVSIKELAEKGLGENKEYKEALREVTADALDLIKTLIFNLNYI